MAPMVASTVCSLHLLLIAFFSASVLVVNILLVLLVALKALASWSLAPATDGSSGSPTWQLMQALLWLRLFPWLW